MYHAADRGIVIAVGSDAHWAACCSALGLDELRNDAALATNTGRLAQRDRIVRAITQRVAEKPAAHWAERLSRAGVPNGLVQTVLEALRDTDASPVTGVPPSVPGRHSIRAAGARRARVTNSSRGLGRVSRALAACYPAAFAGVTTVLPPTHAVVLSTWRPFLISDAGPAPPCPEEKEVGYSVVVKTTEQAPRTDPMIADPENSDQDGHSSAC
jgi:hypothetical protein